MLSSEPGSTTDAAKSRKSLKSTTIHLDVLFRTVSRGSRVPLGPFSEGPEKVREGQIKLEKVRGGKVRES